MYKLRGTLNPSGASVSQNVLSCSDKQFTQPQNLQEVSPENSAVLARGRRMWVQTPEITEVAYILLNLLLTVKCLLYIVALLPHRALRKNRGSYIRFTCLKVINRSLFRGGIKLSPIFRKFVTFGKKLWSGP